MTDKNLVQGALDRLTGRKPMDSRPAPLTSTAWLAEWRELAQLTYGIAEEDPRFESIMRWLNACDVAFSLGSWDTFCEAAAMVKELMARHG